MAAGDAGPTDVDPRNSIARRVGQPAIDRLHLRAYRGQAEIRGFLQQLVHSGVELRQGISRAGDLETMRIESLEGDRLVVRVVNFDVSARQQIFANASLGGRPYFFVLVADRRARAGGQFAALLPEIVYRSERRERPRTRVSNGLAMPRARGRLSFSGEFVGIVDDASPGGYGLLVPEGVQCRVGETGQILPLDVAPQISAAHIEVRNNSVAPERPGWRRIGVRASAVPFGKPLAPSYQRRILEGGVIERAMRTWMVLAATARASMRSRPRTRRVTREESSIEIVDFCGRSGERIRGIIDRWGEGPRKSGVIIPPAWGKTKETMVGLARTIVAAFAAAGEPVVVLRFDGIRKRGESYNDPECGFTGREQHHFTFSQGVEDIISALDFLSTSEAGLDTASLVTFSAAAIEGRRAVVLAGARLAGWVSVVGAADLQHAMCTVSGGIDYLGGAEQGVKFGIQEIQGVEVDMDLAARDALEARLAFLEDSRRDMAAIEIPITWIHGSFDAWMSLERAREVLGTGSAENRKLLVVPTGHQLRTSGEAIDAFQLIAAELVRFACGRAVRPIVPDLRDIRRRAQIERARLPRPNAPRYSFWRDYLLGRDGTIGIDLLSATSAFKEFMQSQLSLLALREGDCIADLGSGTGSFLSAVVNFQGAPRGLRIVEVDLIGDALVRSRRRSAGQLGDRQILSRFVRADLDVSAKGWTIPIRERSMDAVLASLLLSYVESPSVILREIRRVAKRGARIVVSTLKPDADTSELFARGAAELRAGLAREVLSEADANDLDDALRTFLNDAAKLLDLEEQGVFKFWSADELGALMREAGFLDVRVLENLGSPPQAVIAVGRCL